MQIRRYLAFALTILMLLGTLAACAETSDPNAETTPAPTVTNAPSGSEGEVTDDLYDEDGFLKSNLPELDFGNEIITVLWWNDVENPEFFVEDTNGELVNDAIFQRNANVEEKLKVTLDWVDIKGQYNNNVGKEYADHVGNMYASGR